jgi:hypothetical protein
MIINIYQTCSEILCTWYTVTSTETSKPVESLSSSSCFILCFCLMQMSPAVGECHTAVFPEQDLIPLYGQVSDFLSCLDIRSSCLLPNFKFCINYHL